MNNIWKGDEIAFVPLLVYSLGIVCSGWVLTDTYSTYPCTCWTDRLLIWHAVHAEYLLTYAWKVSFMFYVDESIPIQETIKPYTWLNSHSTGLPREIIAKPSCGSFDENIKLNGGIVQPAMYICWPQGKTWIHRIAWWRSLAFNLDTKERCISLGIFAKPHGFVLIFQYQLWLTWPSLGFCQNSGQGKNGSMHTQHGN